MASAAAAIDHAASAKPVDESLWWDSFVQLFEELDGAPLSSDLPDRLVKKLKSNHAWFLDSVARFRAPSKASRLALDFPRISVGSHQLTIKPELKEVALRASTCMCLDEVQSYILVSRYVELNKSVGDVEGQNFLFLVIFQYYLERQCLLKCIRRIFVHVLCTSKETDPSDPIRTEALQLVHDGLERKLLSILRDLLSPAASEICEVDFTILWVEETVTEDNLVLDILFLAYYDNFCTCDCEQWKVLCSLFKDILWGSFSIGKLTISVEARNSFQHAKSQLLLILIETLDLENLLRLIHDEVPFRQGSSQFSLSDISEVDVLVSSLSVLGAAEASPLVLAWAVFICLLLSLPEREDYNALMEIDHIGYLRQAFEAAPFNYLLEVLCNDTLRNSDGPVSGYLSVLRTLISAFIATYELNHQEDDTLNLILDILCKVYFGEESLCMQFWDRDSFVDGPIRSLLYMLGSEFPFRTAELVRFLSALCSGKWSAECVYNFLEKMNSMTLLFEIPGSSVVMNSYDVIETHRQLDIPEVEGLVIPSGTRGQILKVINGVVALVRWECAHSGVYILLLHLAQRPQSSDYEEISLILTLVYRMVSSNTALCLNLLYIDKSLWTQALQNSGHIGRNVRVDVVNVICALIVSLVQDVSNTGLVSSCISILAEMLKCAPCHVIEVASRSNIFGTSNTGSTCKWLLSGGLARMLLADSEENGEFLVLTTSVLEFTIQLVEKGGQDSMASALVVFSLQYVLVNHLHWKYKVKYDRWKVTLKVLEVTKSCIKAIQVSHKLGPMVRDILLFDSSIHNVLCRIMCISPTALERPYISNHYELKEIEDLQFAVYSAFDIVYSLGADLLKETFPGPPIFLQAMLPSTNKPISAVASAVSLMTSRNSEIQVAAFRVLSMLCVIASRVQPYLSENVGLIPDDTQIRDLSATIGCILNDELSANEDLVAAVFYLLMHASRYQPALLVSIMGVEISSASNNVGDISNLLVASVSEPSVSKRETLVDSILKYVKRSELLINRCPHLLLSFVNTLKALWDGGAQYICILENIRMSEMFWKNLVSPILATEANNDHSVQDLNDNNVQCMAYRYQCQGTVLEIMARELFLQKRLSLIENPEKQTSDGRSTELSRNGLNTEKSKPSNVSYPSDILSKWCEGSIMENLIKAYSSGENYEVILHAKISVCMFTVHLIAILSTGDCGSLSISLVEKIQVISNKLCKHPTFSTLLAQYSSCGYSEGKDLTRLVLNDLYYHLQGALEGRKITPGSFQELSDFLLELETFECHECKSGSDIWPLSSKDGLFDIKRLTAELGIDLWVSPEWKASKEIAQRMLLLMHDANLILSLADSKHSALRALISIVSVHSGSIAVMKSTVLGQGISKAFIEASIKFLCERLQETQDSCVPFVKPPEYLLKILVVQAELLLVLSRILFRHISQRTGWKQSLPVSLLLIKASGSSIRFFAYVRASSTVLNEALKFLFSLLLAAVEFSNPKANVEKSEIEPDQFSDAYLACIGLLPILCRYVENSEYSDLSLASMDLIVKGFLAPNTWLPVLQKHLHVQLIVQNIQKKEALASVPIILNFLLTLSHTKGGCEMIYSANLFSSLRVLWRQTLEDQPFPNNSDGSNFSTIFNNDEKHVNLWRLGLAVITSMVYSLGDDASCTDILDSAICYISEEAYMLFCYLSAPYIPCDDHSKKRARAKKTQTSLTALRLTEQILELICVLARHQVTWNKGMRQMDSELRETGIHLLAFISRGVQRLGETSNRAAPLFCLPMLKEEVDLNGKPSFVTSKHGWFALSALSLSTKAEVSAASKKGMSLIPKDQTNGNPDLHQSHFSDTVAIQIYRIAFLLLKFLCIQAKAAAKRAEEMEFIDLAQFPELPMPEVLHGLQDQVIAIVTDVYKASRSMPIQQETEELCLLLLQILEKSLFLELCVSQSCGIRPVLGRVEDFHKEFKLLMQVVEQHTKFKATLRSLRQIVALVYPGLLQTGSLT